MANVRRGVAGLSSGAGSGPTPEWLATGQDLAHRVGRFVATGRLWVEEYAVRERPILSLGAAFGTGVLTGWLLKRR
jgi:hypothetical protein